MTPEISITILFTVLGFYVLEYFVSRKAKSLREDYMKQLQQTHQAELQEVQDKLLLAINQIKSYESELSELRQFAQEQHEAFVRLNEIYKGIDGSEQKQINQTVSEFSGKPFLTDEQLSEMERLNNQTKIDWSKPVPFPEDYQVPKGVEVVVVSEDRDKKDQWYRPVGIKGVTIECDDTPDCDWEDGKKRIHMICDELAPINPTDHPNHPQFKG